MGRGRRAAPRKGTFNPEEDPSIEHHKIGVWDLYVQRDSGAKAFTNRWTWLEDRAELFNNMRCVRSSRKKLMRLNAYVSQISVARDT